MRDQRQILLRFVLQRSHPDTGIEEGVFGAAYELRDGIAISDSDRRSLEGLLAWFRANLAVPERFNRTNRRGTIAEILLGFRGLSPRLGSTLPKCARWWSFWRRVDTS